MDAPQVPQVLSGTAETVQKSSEHKREPFLKVPPVGLASTKREIQLKLVVVGKERKFSLLQAGEICSMSQLFGTAGNWQDV